VTLNRGKNMHGSCEVLCQLGICPKGNEDKNLSSKEHLEMEIIALKLRIKNARIELSALIPNPQNPDFLPALTAGNESDNECLIKVFNLLTN
jgi:hypothetical protein